MVKRLVTYVLLSLLVTVGIAIFLSCGGIGPGVGDYEYDVSGGYQVVHFNAIDIKVVPKRGWNKKKGGRIEETPIIPSKVVEIAWNKDVILAKQQHLRREYPNDPQRTVMQPDPGKYSYWVLTVSPPILHGPFDDVGFRDKRAELGVPSPLILRSVSSYRR